MSGVEEIRERLTNGFSINRIPQKTRDEFIRFSEDEFCGDRGMALRHLWDFYTGLLSSNLAHIEAELAELRSDVDSLKTQPVKVEEKVIKLMSGRELRT